MPSHRKPPRRTVVSIATLLAGLAVAVLAGAAIAHSPTLQIAPNAPVNGPAAAATHESIVVSGAGHAIYELTGDSRQHPKCTRGDGCFSVWLPVTVAAHAAPSRAATIGGRLSVWHRDGVFQVLLAGHPLYTFAGDRARHAATGEGISSFHGVWHVVVTRGGASMTPPATTTPATTTPTSTTPTSTTPAGCLYPPCYGPGAGGY